MAEVWLLMSGEDHEGGDVLGVFATRDLARAAVVESARELPFDLDDVRQEADGSIHVHAGCDWLSLTPHTVRTTPELEGDRRG